MSTEQLQAIDAEIAQRIQAFMEANSAGLGNPQAVVDQVAMRLKAKQLEFAVQEMIEILVGPPESADHLAFMASVGQKCLPALDQLLMDLGTQIAMEKENLRRQQLMVGVQVAPPQPLHVPRRP